MSFEDEKCKGFAHHDVKIVWWKKHMFLGLNSGGGTEHSNLDIYLKTLMDDNIHGPTFFGFNEEEWNAGTETGNSSFDAGPAKEFCVNYEGHKLEEALQLFGSIKLLEAFKTLLRVNTLIIGTPYCSRSAFCFIFKDCALHNFSPFQL